MASTTRALAIVDGGAPAAEKATALGELAAAAVADWWALDDELTLRCC
jgi:hypothetical protein